MPMLASTFLTDSLMTLVLALLVAKALAVLGLEWINRRHVRRHPTRPPAFAKVMSPATYRKAVAYTLADSRFHSIATAWGALVLAVVLLGGVAPRLYEVSGRWLGHSLWADALYLLAVLWLISLPSLPLAWWEQFRLEQRFGFNRSTQALWWTDRLKGLVLSLLLLFPLVVLLLWLVEVAGPLWWLWGFLALFLFQLLMAVVYPAWIMPWFNKFTPLPEGDLRSRLMNLADRTGFKAQTILVMDGSRRSAHANAFFAGFGRLRRIVLYDTLVEQLKPEQLEAVLAHEIGHSRLGHIPRLLAAAGAAMLLGFAVLGWLAGQPWFLAGLGFATDPAPATLAPTLLMVVLLSGLVSFWAGPLMSILSRRYEYQADGFARRAVGAARPLVESLRVLSRKNLSNLTPHPLYSAFYYSHPTLLEREQALMRAEG